MLPNEEPIKVQIQAQYQAYFRLADQLLSLAVSILERPGITVTNIKRDPHKVTGLRLALGLHAKLCKLYRAVYLLCEHGLIAEADTLVRSAFETTLCLRFLLQPQVTLRSQKNSRIPLVIGKHLTLGFRARLYLAHIIFETQRQVRMLKETRGTKRLVKAALIRKTDNNVKKAEADIGPEWTKRLRKTRTYSGLSVRDLAGSFGLQAHYSGFYKYSSGSVHASDVARHVCMVPESEAVTPAVIPSSEGIVAPLNGGGSLLLQSVILLNSRFKLGLQEEINRLGQELRKGS